MSDMKISYEEYQKGLEQRRVDFVNRVRQAIAESDLCMSEIYRLLRECPWGVIPAKYQEKPPNDIGGAINALWDPHFL